MTDVILFHDGCNVCRSISATMTTTFAGNNFNFESINLATQKESGSQAKSLGITRLPSLVIDGKVMRLEDHSPIEHYA